VLKRHKVFSRVTHVIPAIVIHTGVTFVPDLSARAVEVTQHIAMAYVALTLTLAIAAALSASNEVYETYPVSRDRPLKGIVQILQLLVFIVGAAIVISNLIGKSPLIFLSGFGAMTAVLLVVFKDTILGFVASLQLTANDMVRVGDWIEMPAYGADGDVIEVALHTVKVQNFDKTITTIPTYKLIADSFKNWRGMSEAGGRRVKRPIYIDQSSIRFLTDDEKEKLGEFALLREHFENKQRELEDAAEKLGDAGQFAVNRRRLTNVGVFRAYVRRYLLEHPLLHSDMTLLVRQLEPGPDGLPIEIYCFTRTTDWGEYEDVQSDLFDHFLAILPEFGLRLFQKPAGTDLTNLAKATT
jgi:miniconductance mechanosensitive channel